MSSYCVLSAGETLGETMYGQIAQDMIWQFLTRKFLITVCVGCFFVKISVRPKSDMEVRQLLSIEPDMGNGNPAGDR